MTYPRPSHRSPSTIRPLSAELSPLHQADGSASLKAGNTHVMVAVYGPVAPRISHRERIDRGLVSVVFSKGVMMAGTGGGSSNNDDHTNGEYMKPLPAPLPSGGGATERELESFVGDALSSCIMLQRYPRCVIQVVIQIVQADGSVPGVAVNCAVLALMDASVAMRVIPVATTCAVVSRASEESQQQLNDNINSVWMDPSAEEESADGHSIVVFVTEADSNDDGRVPEIIASFTYGAPVAMSGLLQCMDCYRTYNTAIVTFARMALEHKVEQEVKTLWS